MVTLAFHSEPTWGRDKGEGWTKKTQRKGVLYLAIFIPVFFTDILLTTQGVGKVGKSVSQCFLVWEYHSASQLFPQAVINTMCGQGMQDLDYLEASKVIYTNGCIDKLVNWIHSNLFLLGGVALGLAIPQVTTLSNW